MVVRTKDMVRKVEWTGLHHLFGAALVSEGLDSMALITSDLRSNRREVRVPDQRDGVCAAVGSGCIISLVPRDPQSMQQIPTAL